VVDDVGAGERRVHVRRVVEQVGGDCCDSVRRCHRESVYRDHGSAPGKLVDENSPDETGGAGDHCNHMSSLPDQRHP
jgi:hypothetical protein